MNWQDVTEEQWNTYRRIQYSGVTNMFAVNTVVELSGDVLNRDVCVAIMENYSGLENKYEE